ncbi:MAG: hypothetical protein PVH69_03050, partial [Desulfobacterales bacterium]
MPDDRCSCCRQAFSEKEIFNCLGLLNGLKLTDRVTGGGRLTRSHGAANATMRRDLKIRIGVAAVFDKVETLDFIFGRNPQANRFIDEF